MGSNATRFSHKKVHCVSTLPQAPLPPRLPHNIEQSSPCSTVVLFGSHNTASLPQGSCFLAGGSGRGEEYPRSESSVDRSSEASWPFGDSAGVAWLAHGQKRTSGLAWALCSAQARRVVVAPASPHTSFPTVPHAPALLTKSSHSPLGLHSGWVRETSKPMSRDGGF